jgi:hypothetical protein
MTKHIAVRSDGPYIDDQPLEDMFYFLSYAELAEALERKDATLFLVKDDQYYLGGNNFARGWEVRNGKPVRIDYPFEVDLIFKKDSTFIPTPDANVLNTKEFDDLLNDKAKVSALFPDLSPKSFVLHSEADIDPIFALIPSEKIVLKPLSSFGGKGVFIGDREKARAAIHQFPYLAQEFIDTSQGIEGVITAYHDFRIILMNGEVAFTFIRAPQKGSLISNFSLGGWMMPVPQTFRPKGAMDLAQRIDAELAKYGHRIYSVDCAQNIDGRWMLIELNAPPGQQNRLECGDDADAYFEMHAHLLLQACDQPTVAV